jgi:hypothetical protein
MVPPVRRFGAHGGKSHGPSKERDYTQKVNKKMKQQALASVLSKKLSNKEVKSFRYFPLKETKTKLAAELLRKRPACDSEEAKAVRRARHPRSGECRSHPRGPQPRKGQSARAVFLERRGSRELQVCFFEEKAIESLPKMSKAK